MADEMQDPRTYFAAERTFLAWIRTGLGLMGVGFAVARFSLFLREFRQSGALTTVHAAAPTTGLSLYAGVALVALGVLVNVVAVVHHVRTVKELRTGTWVAGRVSKNGIALGVILAAVGWGWEFICCFFGEGLVASVSEPLRRAGGTSCGFGRLRVLAD